MMRNLIIALTFLFGGLAYADFVTTEFTSGGHSFRAEGLSNLKYPFVTIHDDNLLLVTHASTYWDSRKLTWAGISPLVEFFKTRHFPLKYLVTVHEKSVTPEISYPTGIVKNDLHPFQGDSHRIVLKGKNLVITGGNFTICACNATRSIIALSETQDILNVHFALDGIYEGQKGITRTLLELSNQMNDKNFMSYLKEAFFNIDGLPCKEPTLFTYDRSFSYKIYRQGKYIGSYGSGITLVYLHFNLSGSIIQTL